MALDPHVGEMAGTTEVVLIRPPPPNGLARKDLYVAIFNKDIAAITLQVYLIQGTSRHDIFVGSLLSDDRFVLSHKTGEDYEINDSSMSIRAVLGAAPTTQPNWYANWTER